MTEANKLQQAGCDEGSQAPPASGAGSGDDIHFSELVRILRSLAADPERQAHLEQIARTYAQGSYRVDASATAEKIVGDAVRRR
jgi:anti-sigma28 factor (negative regulator of flagellin synthesis)